MLRDEKEKKPPKPTDPEKSDAAGEERGVREEGVRGVLAVPGLTRCVSASSEAGATPASRSLPRRICLGVLWEPRGFPRAAAPRALRGSPGSCRPAPAPRSNASRGPGQPRRGSRAGGGAPLLSSKSLSVLSSPRNGLGKRDSGKPVEGMDVICASKRS